MADWWNWRECHGKFVSTNKLNGAKKKPIKWAYKRKGESADKPGSVVDSHSSGTCVTTGLKQPTRMQRGPRHCIPIWPCSEWGLPCRRVLPLARCALTAPFHPYLCFRRSHRRCLFCCTFRRLAPPRRYLALCPVEPGLSSRLNTQPSDCLADSAVQYIGIWDKRWKKSAARPQSTKSGRQSQDR